MAERRDLGHGRRRAESRPIAQEREVRALESNVAPKLWFRAGLEVSVPTQTRFPWEAEVEAEIERRSGDDFHSRVRVGQGLRAEDDRLGPDLGVDRHLAATALKRSRHNVREQRRGARRRDPVLALAAHERVDIGLFSFERDADPGGRAEHEFGVPIRADRSFLRSELKLRPAQDRLIEVDADRPGDPPRGRRLLAGRRSRQCGVAGESKAANPCRWVALEGAVKFGGRPARPRVHRDAERRPIGPRLFRGEPEDDGNVVGAGKLAAQMRGAIEGGRGGVDLDAGDFRRRSVGCADDPHPPVLHGQAVKPGRMKAGHAQGRQLQRAVRTAGEGQNGLLEANFSELDVAARQFDERQLQPRRAELTASPRQALAR